jgi:UDP:flavonoid glycosyltransferase YjiC (YdhE family)
MVYRQDILFFSRGRGRGHATPDAEIARCLLGERPGIKLDFVSYGVGADTLRSQGYPVIDLHQPEDCPMWEMTGSVFRLLQREKPRLVVSHEELCVMPVASVFEMSSVYLTDWLPPSESLSMQAIHYARHIIFMDEKGYCDIPDDLREKMTFVGPVLQCTALGRSDREAVRRDLGIDGGSKLILVLPGGAHQHSEARAPILNLVLDASNELSDISKVVLWIAGGEDYEMVRGRTKHRDDVFVTKPVASALPLMIAADVIITKGNRVTVLESEALGIPSISISHGHNVVDDNRVARIKSNVAFRAKGLDSLTLSKAVRGALQVDLTIATYPPEATIQRVRETAHLLLDALMKVSCIPPLSPTIVIGANEAPARRPG